MFKLIVLVGAVAGGAAYGVYEYAYKGCDGGSCSLNRSCCSDSPKPADCCLNHEACCETQEACCGEKVATAAKTEACCAAQKACCDTQEACCATSLTSAKVAKKVGDKAAFCCVNPCLGCVLVACDGCAECATCCGGGNAKAAVAGPAAAVAGVK